jgi:hypothetical protein
MKPYTSSKGRFDLRYSKPARNGTGRRTRGGFKASPGGARQIFKAEARNAERYEPPAPTFTIYVTDSFTCPTSCVCSGQCPAVAARVA